MDPRDRVIALMKEAGIPITRENYIATSWGEPLPESPPSRTATASRLTPLRAGYLVADVII